MSIFQGPVRRGDQLFDELVNRVIFQESRGNPNAVSPVGAAGLMQVMPGTARSPGFGVKPLDWNQRFNAQENRRFGEDYLAAMLDRYGGDVNKALAAYNWGAGRADKWSGDPRALPAETRDYIANIAQDPRFGKPKYGPNEAARRLGQPVRSPLQNEGNRQAAENMAAQAVGSRAGTTAMDRSAMVNSMITAAPGYTPPSYTTAPQVQSTAADTQRVQSRYTGQLQATPQLPVAQLVR